MKLKILASASKDFDWFFTYYQNNFPEGLENAKRGYFKSINLLLDNPLAGKKIDRQNLRTFPILRTPFAIIYRVTQTELQVARIWDQRSQRPKKWI